MSKANEKVQLYTLSMRREVPIMGADSQPTGEVKHLRERHAGCTHEQANAIRKKTTHVADAMIEKLRMGVPGAIESTTDIGSPVNMPPASPRKPRETIEGASAPRREKGTRHAPQAQETARAGKSPAEDLLDRKRKATGIGTLADLVNVLAEEEL